MKAAQKRENFNIGYTTLLTHYTNERYTILFKYMVKIVWTIDISEKMPKRIKNVDIF